MNYHQTLDYLFNLYPSLAKSGWKAYKPGLDRVLELAEITGNPQKKYPTIHVAGTNGKGSVCHLLSAALQKAGYKVGLYASPHLVDFSERIKVNGVAIDQKYVVDFVKKYDPLYRKVQPSFFEFTNMMAFDYFRVQEVDIAILETGLGGRLDSTNIIQPEISVITNIGLDHQKFLGDTLPEIASEKAGIIKSNTPVVIGEQQFETTKVFKQMAKKNQSEICWASDFSIPKLSSDLTGEYQKNNLKTAYIALQKLKEKGWEISENDIFEGFKNVQKLTNLMGRWQIFKEQPKVILDTAHNSEGLKFVVNQLLSESLPVTMILGMAADKDHDKVFKILPKHFNYIWTSAENARMLSADEIQNKALVFGLSGISSPNVTKAYQNQLKVSQSQVIFIGGSNFLVGEFLSKNRTL